MADRVKTAPYRFRLSRTDTLALDRILPASLRRTKLPGIFPFVFALYALSAINDSTNQSNEVVKLICILGGIAGSALFLGYAVSWIYSALGPVRTFYRRDCSFSLTERGISLRTDESNNEVGHFAWSDLYSVEARAHGNQVGLRFKNGSESVVWLLAPSTFKSNSDWRWFITQLRTRQVRGYESLPHFVGPWADRNEYPLLRGPRTTFGLSGRSIDWQREPSIA